MSGEQPGQRHRRARRRRGRELFREWFARLDAAAERGEPAAYVFVMGSLAEILRVFDFPLVFPEINSLQTAVRRVAHEYLNEAEDYGYSPDICGYVKADVARAAARRRAPDGTDPEAGARRAHQRLQHLHQVGRDLGAHVPHSGLHARRARHARRGRPDLAGRSRLRARPRATSHAQLRELIALCEQVTGSKFDIDRLREVAGPRQRR